MFRIYIKIIKKLVILLILMAIPIGVYIYMDEDVQTMMNLNLEKPINRYIIDANFYPEEKIDIKEKIIFTNNLDREIEKIYLYISPRMTEINKVTLSNKTSSYKIIGDNKDILMVLLEEPLKPNGDITIGVKCIISMKKGNKDNSNIYSLRKWYPIIAPIDKGGWNVNVSGEDKLENVDNANYSLGILVPKDYSTSTLGKVKSKYIIGNKIHYNIEAGNVKWMPLLLDGNNTLE